MLSDEGANKNLVGWGAGGQSSSEKFFQVGGDEQILGWWGGTLLPLPQVVKTLHIYNICIYVYIYT